MRVGLIVLFFTTTFVAAGGFVSVRGNNRKITIIITTKSKRGINRKARARSLRWLNR